MIVHYIAVGTVGGLIRVGAPAPADATVRIGLLAGPIHTGFLLPMTPQVRDKFPFVADAGLPLTDPAARWFVVGWGARDFYMTTGGYTCSIPAMSG